MLSEAHKKLLETAKDQGYQFGARKTLTISDHALVRYIERVKGESLESIRDEIRELLHTNENNQIPSHGYDDGFLYIVEQLADTPTVITVLAPGHRPKRGRKWVTRTAIHVPATPLANKESE